MSKHSAWVAVAGLLACGLATAAAPPWRLLLVGDSTMAPRTGYGDALCARVRPPATCLNLARGGRSSGSYRAEGLWDAVLDKLHEEGGHQTVVLIQFGHNDQPGKPGRSTDLATEFPTNLARYVAEVRALGAQPVLVTPLTRRSFHDGQLQNDLVPWADAARRVAAAANVPLLELNALSAAAVQPLGQAGADQLAEAPPGQPRFDRTHLGVRGACLFAGIVEQALLQALPAAIEHFAADRRSCSERE